MNCRFCQNKLKYEFVDLGFSPPSNSFLIREELNEPEVFFPLKIMVCEECFLVQIDEFAKHEDIFNSDYVYFSSFSTSWLAHSKAYTEMMIKRFSYDHNSKVIEIASNDGYLLQFFKDQGVSVLGIEPTPNTAAAAKEKGIESIIDFFGVRLAEVLVNQGTKADLLLGNNVLAHVPDINDFVSGLKILLNPKGVITIEFPHILQMIHKNQFDTIYHEHFSYLSFSVVQRVFNKHGLVMFDVEEISTHGGSLRVFAKHAENESQPVSERVEEVLLKEVAFGINEISTYQSYQESSEKVKDDFLSFLIMAKREGKMVVGYGAAAKGVTLLNFCGVRKDLMRYVVDASPHKRDKFLPGIHIPVLGEENIMIDKPDYVVILPWNLEAEITKQLAYVREWGGQFVTAVPKIKVF
jgi:SAM-dependent methyltransferase